MLALMTDMIIGQWIYITRFVTLGYILMKKNATLDDVGVSLVTGDISYRDGRVWVMANGVSMKDWSRITLFAIRLQSKGLPNVPVS